MLERPRIGVVRRRQETVIVGEILEEKCCNGGKLVLELLRQIMNRKIINEFDDEV